MSFIVCLNPIEAFGQLSEIVEQFSLEKFGRSTAKFDTVELRIVNSKTLQLLEFEDVRDRIEQFGLSKIDAEFWNAVRGNISYFHQTKTMSISMLTFSAEWTFSINIIF